MELINNDVEGGLKMINPSRKITCGVLLCLCAGKYAYAGDIDDWQYQQLFNPSQTLLLAESRGHITIYDRLPIEDVDRALDQQFERVDSMMFTRIRHATPDGESVEDDGC